MARKIREFGDIEDHYEVLDHIGHGAQADLHLGRDRETGEWVAVKVQREREFESTRTFASLARTISREGRAYQRLISAGSCGTLRLFGAGDYRGHRCIVLEYVDGDLMWDVMNEDRPIREEQTVASIIGQLCETLHDMHDRGFVHRDVKPENIMMEPDGRVRLLDLGLTIGVGKRTPRGCGTIGYAPPEQLDPAPNGVSARADIFALGCLLLEMTVITLPYDGCREGMTCEHPIVLPPHKLDLLPPAFAELALSMVELAPERRPGSVREVYDGLRHLLPRVGGRPPLKPLKAADPTEYYRTRPHRW
ncbi:serine/threonine protein kinase [Kitasatospora sp. NPDC088548]|uniref:serine/threonine protein kinase n=1 Tax=Kitasatospora sp. NPDC088548 TaxID=3364075 RepID=UPI0037FAE530